MDSPGLFPKEEPIGSTPLWRCRRRDQRCAAGRVGRTLEVLVDEIGKDGVIAREPGDAPKSMGWCTRGGRALAIGSRWKSSPAMSMTWGRVLPKA